MVITACSQRIECPKTDYPTLEAIEKIPPIKVKVRDGSIEENSTQDVFNGIKALRESERYYYETIEEYRKEFKI